MKRNIIILTLVTLFFTGCRKEADYYPYIGENGPLAYNSYASQFDYLWKCISMGYVFWDIEKTDWDAVYEELMPQFEALDARHEAGGDVTLDDLETLYGRALGGMVDHHMTVAIKNIHPSPNDTKPYAAFRPGQAEVATRDYFFESVYDEKVSMRAFLDGSIDGLYSLADHQSATVFSTSLGDSVTYHYCLINLPDGRQIPYLWQSGASLTSILSTLGSAPNVSAAYAVIHSWFTAATTLPRAKLAGIILDNRANSGGETSDVYFVIGSFLNEKAVWGENRTKEGPGHFEHTAWVPTYVSPNPLYHRDITAEKIPYVVLCDINSISMGEIEPSAIKELLPTSYIIGERTCGATGSLMPTDRIDITYGGPFGDISKMNHYVYTSTMECRIGGVNREGTGLVPDKVVNRKDYNGDFKPQLDEAIQYIQSIPIQGN